MLQYVAKNARLAPKDPEVALIVDEWLEHHRDFVLPMDMNADPTRYGITGMDALWIEEVHIPEYLCKLEVHLNEHGATSCIGGLDRRSMADIVWRTTLRRIRSERTPSCFADFPNVRQYMGVCDISEEGAASATGALPPSKDACTPCSAADGADDPATSEDGVPIATGEGGGRGGGD